VVRRPRLADLLASRGDLGELRAGTDAGDPFADLMLLRLLEKQAAATPAQRLAIALAAVHAARPGAIRDLTLEDIDMPSRRISIAGHRQPLGELTRDALLAWLDYRRAAWPDTANRHVLITRKSALGTGPVSASYLGRHHRGISLEHIRRDRILHEALATGADSLHLALVFNIDHTNAMPAPAPPATFSRIRGPGSVPWRLVPWQVTCARPAGLVRALLLPVLIAETGPVSEGLRVREIDEPRDGGWCGSSAGAAGRW
jgi:hypothetical protein